MARLASLAQGLWRIHTCVQVQGGKWLLVDLCSIAKRKRDMMLGGKGSGLFFDDDDDAALNAYSGSMYNLGLGIIFLSRYKFWDAMV